VIQETENELEVARARAERAEDLTDLPNGMPMPLRPSRLAAAAGWLGAIGWFGFADNPEPALLMARLAAAPFAVVIGLIALRDLRRDLSLYGRGRAMFGLASGLLFSLVLLALIASA
jgi:hypothetical protein